VSKQGLAAVIVRRGWVGRNRRRGVRRGSLFSANSA